MHRAVLLVVLAGCGLPEPLNRELDAPDGAEDAAAIAVAEWSERVPQAAGLSADVLPPVRWFEGDCLNYGDGAPCMDGRFWQSPAVEIHLLVRPTLHESALVHELLHWSLGEVVGDTDHDHRRKQWRELPDVQGILASAGL